MDPSDACLALIKKFEGCSLTAYPDEGGFSIGYGHHENVTEGMQITQEWADRLLQEDAGKAAAAVRFLVEPLELTQGRFDALVDFVYNLGAGALEKSTLLQLVRAENYAAAAGEFTKWTYKKGPAGTEIQDKKLLERRQAERWMFLGGSHAA